MFIPGGITTQRVNVGHPMAEGLDQVWLPGEANRFNGTTSDAFNDRFCYDAVRQTFASSRAFFLGSADKGNPVLSPWGPAYRCNDTSDASNYFYGILHQAGDPTVSVFPNYTQLLICRGVAAPAGSQTYDTAPANDNENDGIFSWDDDGTTAVGSYIKVTTNGTEVIDFQANKSITADTWHHLAAVGDTGNTVTSTYLDGEFSASEPYAPSGTVTLGSLFGGGGQPWPGSIFMYAIWRRALTAAEIQSMYADPLQIFQKARIPAFQSFGRVYLNDAATLDGGEVEQAYPGPSNWSDTSIDIQAVPDTSGLSGQLYVIVERADGSIASRAVSVQSGPTGTGTPAAQDASVAGTGNMGRSGTGTPAAQDSTMTGIGFIASAGTGVLTAQDASASGTGLRIATVSLVLTAANNRELKDAAGTLVSSLSNIVWEWYDTPGSTAGEPIDSGTFNTDASGEATITVNDSALADGEFGQLIIYHPSDPLIRATLRVPVTD